MLQRCIRKSFNLGDLRMGQPTKNGQILSSCPKENTFLCQNQSHLSHFARDKDQIVSPWRHSLRVRTVGSRSPKMTKMTAVASLGSLGVTIDSHVNRWLWNPKSLSYRWGQISPTRILTDWLEEFRQREGSRQDPSCNTCFRSCDNMERGTSLYPSPFPRDGVFDWYVVLY